MTDTAPCDSTPLEDTPHDDPETCPTWYNWCNCASYARWAEEALVQCDEARGTTPSGRIEAVGEHWTDALAGDACAEARAWASTQPDLPTAWAECPRGDWMIWLAQRCPCTRAEARRLGFVCAERARLSALRALDAAGVSGEAVERLRSCAPIVDVRTARRAADAAYAASDAYAYAAYAAYAASDAYAAAADDAWAAENRAIADLVREAIPAPPRLR